MKLSLAILCLAFSGSLLADETADLLKNLVPAPVIKVDARALTEDGFTPIFDGTSLDGWEIKGSKAEFTVADGQIIGTAKDLKGNSFLCTKKTYSDFIYIFEMRFDDLSGNSGCMFRGLYDEEKNRVYGYQCEHDNGFRGWTAGIYDEARRGWIFPNKNNGEHCDAFSLQGRRIFKPADWNTIVIQCVGNRLQIWLNGEIRADYTDRDENDATLEGFFGLQVHGGASCNVRWRNLYVKELTP